MTAGAKPVTLMMPDFAAFKRGDLIYVRQTRTRAYEQDVVTAYTGTFESCEVHGDSIDRSGIVAIVHFKTAMMEATMSAAAPECRVFYMFLLLRGYREAPVAGVRFTYEVFGGQEALDQRALMEALPRAVPPRFPCAAVRDAQQIRAIEPRHA